MQAPVTVVLLSVLRRVRSHTVIVCYVHEALVIFCLEEYFLQDFYSELNLGRGAAFFAWFRHVPDMTIRAKVRMEKVRRVQKEGKQVEGPNTLY